MTDQTAVLVAFVAALAGLGGAGLGAWIAARETRRASVVAKAESQAAREDARRARFADRIVELAAIVLGTSTSALVDVGSQVGFRQQRPTDRPPIVVLDIPKFVQRTQELSLLLRSQSARTATDEILQATLSVTGFALPSSVSGSYQVAIVESDELDRFEAARMRFANAAVTFERAIREDLGVGDPAC